ncbi:Na+/melibiose symporter-like transporter [Allocatelliglobosispora scoriae]|uniref:Na+/melibiose symporter-like transporter n=1 Tax=Allocatelliglobosispora scoriae TaxID=643052 RepID=A0A841C0Q4_9ACTN|nr:MFS transporter [Allocatelliglobosispora scoriae]MBB5872540.1 Na+/melibiose symporter-like transporter [Allocatelliglobosispora scoriae]
MEIAERQTLTRGTRAGYAMGSLATGAFGTVPGLLLLPYLTDTMGITAFLAGLLVLVPKAWDVLINPVAGRISDRTQSRWGARRPYLLFGGLAMAACFAAIFIAPFGTGGGGGLYVAVAFLVTATAFAFFQVPYVAMPAEMTDGYAERTRLMTWRIALLAVAILVSGAVSPIVVKAGGDGISGHRWMGLFVATVIAVGAVGAFIGTRRAPLGTVTESEPSLRAQLAVARRNRPFVILLITFVIQSIGIATMLAGVKYVAEHVLERPDDGPTLLFVCFVAPALLVMPLWTRLGTRIGKKSSLILASVIFTAGALGLLSAGVAPPWVAYLVTAVIGCGYAGQQVFALSMLPDCIAYDAMRTGKRQAGVFTGLWTAGETLGLALGPGIYAAVLAISGYVSSSTGIAAAQSSGARLGVLLGFTAIPALLVGPIIVLLRRYDLTEQQLHTVE